MPDYTHLCGYKPHPEAAEELQSRLMGIWGAAAGPTLDSGLGKFRYLHRCVTQVMGKPFQEIQTIGDCVPHGYQRGYVTLGCVKILAAGLTTTVPRIPATESWYGWGRVNIAKNRWAGGDGMSGSDAINAAKQIGIVYRKKYPTVDLSLYSGSRARSWGQGQGPPAELKAFAEADQLLDYYPVNSYEQARDFIYSGYPVMVASDWGFDNARRDAQGFIQPNGVWPHQMLFTGFNDDPKRPGLLLDNRSWPDDSVQGVQFEDFPGACGLVDAEYCDKMLRGISTTRRNSSGMPDSYVMWSVEGFQDYSATLDQFDMFEPSSDFSATW